MASPILDSPVLGATYCSYYMNLESQGQKILPNTIFSAAYFALHLDISILWSRTTFKKQHCKFHCTAIWFLWETIKCQIKLFFRLELKTETSNILIFNYIASSYFLNYFLEDFKVSAVTQRCKEFTILQGHLNNIIPVSSSGFPSSSNISPRKKKCFSRFPLETIKCYF